MKVLLDNNMPKVLRKLLKGHLVIHVHDLGWADEPDERLLRLAEANGYEVLITLDKRMHTQQNNETRRISLVVVEDNRCREIRRAYEWIAVAVERSSPGSYEYVGWSKVRENG